MARTAWILGAGFSKPLGGPLLNELLTPASQARMRAAFPKTDSGALLRDVPSETVYRLYWEHGPNSDTASKHWDDAEAFLEALDTAATAPDSPTAVLIGRLIRSKLSPHNLSNMTTVDAARVSAAAKRLIAAECCAFLHNIDTKTEKWAPYRRWARKVPLGDTVITFNYDRVVETASKAGGIIESVVPDSQMGSAGDVPLLKLHGSVDWSHNAEVFHQSDRADFAVVCSDDEMVIGSPGPTKKAVAARLHELWDLACNRIRNSEVVVFVGYRFPPSDSQSRRKLVDALTNNHSTRLMLRTVLGPNTTNPDTLRLKGILEYAMHAAGRIPVARGLSENSKSYALKVHPLGAEDFLDLFEPDHLNDERF